MFVIFATKSGKVADNLKIVEKLLKNDLNWLANV